MARLAPGDAPYLYVKGGRIVYEAPSGMERLRAGQGAPGPAQSSWLARNDGREPAAVLT